MIRTNTRHRDQNEDHKAMIVLIIIKAGLKVAGDEMRCRYIPMHFIFVFLEQMNLDESAVHRNSL